MKLLSMFFIVLGPALINAQADELSVKWSYITNTDDGRLVQLPRHLELWKKEFVENYSKPPLKVSIAMPVIQGKAEITPEGLNQLIESTIRKHIDAFKIDLMSYDALSTKTNSLNIDFQIFSANSKRLSIRFGFYYGGENAAHPWETYDVVNYDLTNHKVVNLEDLFLPNSNYLEVISKICIKELKKQSFVFYDEGVKPTKENFRNWNLEERSIRIFFEPYQIAPRVSVSPEIHILFDDLTHILKNSI